IFYPAPAPDTAGVTELGSTRATIAVVSRTFINAITGALMFLIFPLILQLVLRSWYLAIGIFWLFIAAFIGSPGLETTPEILLATAIAWAAALYALYRFGMVAGAAAIFSINLQGLSAPAADWSAWYATPGLLTGGVVLLLAFVGFYLAVGGRLLLRVEGLAPA
ncbi:MAG: hypothetical protein NZ561_03715, partial [Phycisphaerae bacterium]|nr:hypothetical protein [Phycisphaerae bacterium]